MPLIGPTDRLPDLPTDPPGTCDADALAACPLCDAETPVDADGVGPNLCCDCGEWRCSECDQKLEGNCPCQEERE